MTLNTNHIKVIAETEATYKLLHPEDTSARHIFRVILQAFTEKKVVTTSYLYIGTSMSQSGTVAKFDFNKYDKLVRKYYTDMGGRDTNDIIMERNMARILQEVDK